MIATAAAIVLTQRLRRDGAVFSNIKIAQVEGPAALGRNLRICFRLGRDDQIRVEVVDSREELVRTLIRDREVKGGPDSHAHCRSWDGRNDAGKEVSGGRYALRITMDRAARSAVGGEAIKLVKLEPRRSADLAPTGVGE